MSVYERLSQPEAVPACNPENNTGFGFLVVELYGDKYQVHNTRNLVYNFGLCAELQQRGPVNPYEKLMRHEFDKRHAYPILAELQTKDPSLYDDMLALKQERWPSGVSGEDVFAPMEDGDIPSGIDERMNVHHYLASQAFDAMVPIARSRLRHYDVGFFCR